jgi:serine/threonine protein kinase
MAKLGSINKYSIEYPLGEGADAVVYLAKDTELNK